MAATAPPSFRMIAPHFVRSGSLPEVRPLVDRRGWEFQNIYFLAVSGIQPHAMAIKQTQIGLIDVLDATEPTSDVEVTSVVFEGQSASLYVGPFELVSERDFVIVGGAAAIATSIAAAISLLPGYSAMAVGAVVTVTGPLGAICPEYLRFDASYRGGERNFTFTWNQNEGFLGYGTSPLQPMESF